MDDKTTIRYSTDVAGLLGVAFVVLKLIGVINWSWWYVTMPFWGGLVIILTIFLVGAIGISLFYGFKMLVQALKSDD